MIVLSAVAFETWLPMLNAELSTANAQKAWAPN